jgi:2-hydroxychromene-2-carboxylate isomerase
LRKNGEAMSKVEFHFDFGSPNAYLAHLVIPEIEQRTGAKFEYVPVLLGGVYKLTGNRSPGRPRRHQNKPTKGLRVGTLHQAPWHHILPAQSSSRSIPDDHAGCHRSAEAGGSSAMSGIYRHVWSGKSSTIPRYCGPPC